MTTKQARRYKLYWYFIDGVQYALWAASLCALIIIAFGAIAGVLHYSFGPTPKADGRIPVLQPTK